MLVGTRHVFLPHGSFPFLQAFLRFDGKTYIYMSTFSDSFSGCHMCVCTFVRVLQAADCFRKLTSFRFCRALRACCWEKSCSAVCVTHCVGKGRQQSFENYRFAVSMLVVVVVIWHNVFERFRLAADLTQNNNKSF